MIVTGAPVEQMELRKWITGKSWKKSWTGQKAMWQRSFFVLGCTGKPLSFLWTSETTA